jgi:hypothetical protein
MDARVKPGHDTEIVASVSSLTHSKNTWMSAPARGRDAWTLARVAANATDSRTRDPSMKLILSVLGLVLIVAAVVYFVMPADQLPSFMPGHEAGVARVHMKHGVVAGVAGVILLAAGWFMGRR